MNTLADIVRSARYLDGWIVIQMESGVEIRFPVSKNPVLAKGTEKEIGHIEISPCGLHWPDLNEDLSFKGLLDGNFGQHQK